MREPVSIRFRNPGAMWGGRLAIKWGAQKKAVPLNDGKGQGNNIAVFPTYVQGICAQLDLWRTSKHYRNKPFEDAIAVWSGHNEVESYIKFVLDRVPGMKRGTVMNDAFWRSSMGVAFLKAQAWHEAGKRYPAPTADWIEAQNIVFGTVKKTGPVDAAPPEPPKGPDGPLILVVKQKLDVLGYHEFGMLDDEWGGRTVAAIAAYKLDRGLAGPAEIDDALMAQLDLDIENNWHRPMKETREKATVDDLAPHNETIKQNWWTRLWAKIIAIPAGISALVSGAMGKFPDAKATYIDPVMEFFVDVPGWLWFVLAAGVAVSIWVGTRKSDTTVVQSFQTGKLLR